MLKLYFDANPDLENRTPTVYDSSHVTLESWEFYISGINDEIKAYRHRGYGEENASIKFMDAFLKNNGTLTQIPK